MLPDKYALCFPKINEAITAFAQLLAPEQRHHFPAFDEKALPDGHRCIQILHKNWDGFAFPCAEKRGVYFLLGSEVNNSSKVGVYIGKASCRSSIGRRLWSHLRPCREEERFCMNGYHNERYILDYMAAIDLSTPELGFLSPALEEFLISYLCKGRLNLLNGTGT